MRVIVIWSLLALASSPLSHTLHHGPTAEKHLIETMPGGLAIFDFDGDLRPDLFFTNASRPNRLYRNAGDGQWQDVTAESGLEATGYTMGVAAGDFDGDGRPDLFVTGVNQNHLYKNLGQGKFRSLPFPSTGWSISAGWFDYDHDGDLDLFVVNYVEWDPKTEPYCGDQKAGYRTYCHPRHYKGLANALFRNDGGGKFTDVSKDSRISEAIGKGMSVAFADYDRDGWLDVLVTNDAIPNFLFHNNQDGTFSERGMVAGIGLNDDGRAVSSMGADFRDMDGDGLPEIFITALINETFPLFHGLPKGLFEDITYRSRTGAATLSYSGWSSGIFDFDNDGKKDLFAANGDVNDNTEVYSNRKSRQPNLILWNAGNQTFRPEAIGTSAQHRGAAFGDLNGDGRIDIVTSRLGETPTIWWNDRGKKNHWLIVETTLGAEVIVDNQHNQVTQAVGYASSSFAAAHFGLGQAERVNRIEVRFPGGGKRVLTNQAADQRIRLGADGGR